jgi:hypothetical protein
VEGLVEGWDESHSSENKHSLFVYLNFDLMHDVFI